MLNVLTVEEVFNLIEKEFNEIKKEAEQIPIISAAGRILADNVISSEYVPDFNRSTVDGYACKATDTFGCTESIPAMLTVSGEVLMGQSPLSKLTEGECCYVPTGGAIPEEADCVVMLEYAEKYGDGTVGIMKPGAPGLNMIYRGDDVKPGDTVLKKGRCITPCDIGALAATGKMSVNVVPKLKVGIISTGDELVDVSEKPQAGQVRDVNSSMLSSLYEENGAEVILYGIIRDDKELLRKTVNEAIESCDMVVISGGSSVGVKDAACEIIEGAGKVLAHGIAIKPGKPTIIGKSGEKPIIGLPGHPVAAYYIAKIFTIPLADRLTGKIPVAVSGTRVKLSERLGANHGRTQINAVKIEDGTAYPVHTKSGLITSLAGSDGYMVIDRDCEGLEEGTEIEVKL